MSLVYSKERTRAFHAFPYPDVCQTDGWGRGGLFMFRDLAHYTQDKIVTLDAWESLGVRGETEPHSLMD